MGHRVLAGVVTAVVGLSAAWGCAQVSLTQREPGAKLVTFPGKVAEEYKCSERQLPFFEVEVSELSPHTIRPGSKIQHRFIYVMCPSRISGVIPGTLTTRIHHRGKPIYTNMTRHELQPGRWAVDATITLPKAAASGIYTLEARFKSRSGGFNAQADFLIEGRAR